MTENDAAKVKIAVAGAGYVGLANAIFLARDHDVWVYDNDSSRVEAVNRRQSPFVDADIEDYLAHQDLSLRATTLGEDAYAGADFVVIATPTNYDERSHHLNTESVEAVLVDALHVQPNTTIVVKSTVPLGFTAQMRERHEGATIIYAPEFLREGRALYDSLHPSRIVIGSNTPEGRTFGKFLIEGALEDDVRMVLSGSHEAEAIKLLANTYLAMRVAYFNEVDTFAMRKHLSTSQLLEGICLDPRIGQHYNNPSFGFGGYCLPKDTQQLQANCEDVPQKLMSDITAANEIRKDAIAEDILRRNPTVAGIYRLVMKSESDNFRDSAVLGVMDRLADRGVRVVIYEPRLRGRAFHGYKLIHELDDFKRVADVIVANRHAEALDDVSDVVYTRDVYGTD